MTLGAPYRSANMIPFHPGRLGLQSGVPSAKFVLMNNVIDHVAIVVKSIEATCRDLNVDAPADTIESFPNEGTRELYVGESGKAGRLLLMQPTGPGPYQRALDKRGEGLHHVAFQVEDVFAYVDTISGSGWFLHPRSLREFATCRTVWLCRPGAQCLFEVTENKDLADAPSSSGGGLITEVQVPVSSDHDGLVEALGVAGLYGVVAPSASLMLAGKRFHFDRAASRSTP